MARRKPGEPVAPRKLASRRPVRPRPEGEPGRAPVLPPGKFTDVPGQVTLDCAGDDHLACGGCGCECHPEPGIGT